MINFKLNEINPRNGSKYSPNLYKFLKKNKGRSFKVFEDKEGYLWIGDYEEGFGNPKGYFVGHRLIRVLCEGSKVIPFAWIAKSLGELKELRHFWDDYKIIGRCAIDLDHSMWFQGDENRFSKSEFGESRSCDWCGQKQKRVETSHKIIKTRWEND